MKNFFQTAIGVVIFIAVAMGFLTLIRNANRKPSVILTSTECAPPCWYGIQPGRSTSSQVYAVIGAIPEINQNMVWENERGGALFQIGWYFRHPVEDGTGSAYFKDDRVTAITILTTGTLTLEDLFEKTGQPQNYWAKIGAGENRDYLDVMLFDLSQGFLAEVLIDFEAGATQVEIQPRTPVFRVAYFDPAQFDELLKTGVLFDQPANTRNGVYPAWSGFGSIPIAGK